MNQNQVDNVVYLARCAVDNIEPDSKLIGAMDLDAVYRVAERHMLASVCDITLKTAGIEHDAFREARGKAIRKVAEMDCERAKLFSILDAAGVWYAPLKGCVLQNLYPSYGMRQMSDNDILFDASHADEVRIIMESMGFSTERFGPGVHDVYHKEPVCNFEMHREFFGPLHGRKLYEYYRDAKRLLIADNNKTMGMHLSDEDFYLYMLAHEYRHFSGMGTGLRSLLDTYVFLKEKADALDWCYVGGELEKLGLRNYEARNKQLAMRLFGGEKLDAADTVMLAYIVESGAYGIASHQIANGVEHRGCLGYLLYRTFMPYGGMVLQYPVLRKLPILLPGCWFLRIGKAIVNKPKDIYFEISQTIRVQPR